jgi:hypothetical protein
MEVRVHFPLTVLGWSCSLHGSQRTLCVPFCFDGGRLAAGKEFRCFLDSQANGRVRWRLSSKTAGFKAMDTVSVASVNTLDLLLALGSRPGYLAQATSDGAMETTVEKDPWVVVSRH